MNTDDPLLTPAETAAYLRCSVRSLQRYRDSGQLKAERRSPRCYRYRRSDVDFFRDQCRENAGRAEQ